MVCDRCKGVVQEPVTLVLDRVFDAKTGPIRVRPGDKLFVVRRLEFCGDCKLSWDTWMRKDA